MMVQQGEGGGGGVAVKSRRNGARLFKNPPQPHMCIQDYIQGSWDPCYVNVLSWGKIAMPHRPSEPVPLWGGMKISTPRTEKPQCAVFAVMANPEILRLNGKNAQDPQERSALIDLLLDFVEAMNEGVVFTRCYTVLKDRDITGELKEVWMAVQVKRDKEQESQQETWIDVQPPAPQYPQFEMTPDYSYQASNEQQVYQTAGHMVAHNQQYHGNVQPPQINQDQYNYGGERGGGRSQNQQPQPQQQNCPAYPTPQYQFQQLPRQLVPQYINSNIHPGVSPSYGNPGVPVGANVNPNIPGHYQQYIALQQQMVGQRQLDNVMHAARENHASEMQQQTAMHVSHMQSVPQYEQPPLFGLQPGSQMSVLRLGRPHMGVTQKSNANKRQTSNSPTHGSVATPSSAAGIQQQQQQGKDASGGVGGEKSPVKGFRLKILRDHQGGSGVEKGKQGSGNGGGEKNDGGNDAAAAAVVVGRWNVQVTDLDEELDGRGEEPKKMSREKEDGIKKAGVKTKQPNVGSRKYMRQQILNSSEEITVLESDLPLEGTEDNVPSQNLGNKPLKTQILVLKRNSTKSSSSSSSSSNGDSKSVVKESKEQQKVAAKNAIRLTKLEGQQIYDLESSERVAGNPVRDKNDEQQQQQQQQQTKNQRSPVEIGENKSGDQINATDVTTNANSNPGLGKNGYIHQKSQKDRTKRSQTVNNIIKNVFKINPSTSSGDEKMDRVNNHHYHHQHQHNQLKNQNGKTTIGGNNEEVYRGYAILRKSETNQDDNVNVVNEIAKISLQDCKETTEAGAVGS